MHDLGSKGRFALNDSALAGMRQLFSASRADENETRDTIRDVHKASGYVLDPHTAVGVAVARKLGVKKADSPLVVLGTAHPAKFPEAVEAACGVDPQLPARFSDLMSRKERVTNLPNDAKAVADFVVRHARAAKGAAA